MEYYVKDEFGNFYLVSNLDIKKDDTIVVKYDAERTDLYTTREVYKTVQKCFSENKVICIPSCISVNVKGEENENN